MSKKEKQSETELSDYDIKRLANLREQKEKFDQFNMNTTHIRSLMAAHEKKAKKSRKSPKKKAEIRKSKEKKKDPKVKATHLCDTCGKHLKSRGGLKSHISAVHDNLKPHACTICTVDFVKIIIKFFFLNLIKRN